MQKSLLSCANEALYPVGSRAKRYARYTYEQWGEARLSRYIAALEKGMADLSAGRIRFKTLSGIFPRLRMAHIRHHYVFCVMRSDMPALIVAILHERMDIAAQLVDRMKE